MAGIDIEGRGGHPHFSKEEIASLALPLRVVYKTNIFCSNHLNIATFIPCMLTSDIASYAEERMLKARTTQPNTPEMPL